MGAFKGDFLDLLPQEAEVCFKLTSGKCDVGQLVFDTSGLYLSESFVKKGWRMIINKAREEVYILTGKARIKVYHVCGNVRVMKSEKKEIGRFYIRLPYLCTGELLSPAPELRICASFKQSRIYRCESEGECFIVGTVKISKADT